MLCSGEREPFPKEQQPEPDGWASPAGIAGGQRKEEDRDGGEAGELGTNTQKPHAVGRIVFSTQ